MKSVFIVRAFAMALFASLVFSPAFADEATARVYLFAAEEALAEKDYSGALSAVRSAERELGSSNALLKSLMVKAYLGQGAYTLAKKTFKEFIAFKPNAKLAREMSPYLLTIDKKIEEIEERKQKESRRMADLKKARVNAERKQITLEKDINKLLEKINETLANASSIKYRIKESSRHDDVSFTELLQKITFNFEKQEVELSQSKNQLELRSVYRSRISDEKVIQTNYIEKCKDVMSFSRFAGQTRYIKKDTYNLKLPYRTVSFDLTDRACTSQEAHEGEVSNSIYSDFLMFYLHAYKESQIIQQLKELSELTYIYVKTSQLIN